MQHAIKTNNFATFKEYTDLMDEQSRHLCTLRGLFEFKKSKPVPISDVEPATEIVHRSPPAPCRSAPSRKKLMKRSPSP